MRSVRPAPAGDTHGVVGDATREEASNGGHACGLGAGRWLSACLVDTTAGSASPAQLAEGDPRDQQSARRFAAPQHDTAAADAGVLPGPAHNTWPHTHPTVGKHPGAHAGAWLGMGRTCGAASPVPRLIGPAPSSSCCCCWGWEGFAAEPRISFTLSTT